VYLGDLGAGRGGEDGGTGGDVDGVRAVAASADNVDGVVQAVDPAEQLSIAFALNLTRQTTQRHSQQKSEAKTT
jgi:hypothetical protein